MINDPSSDRLLRVHSPGSLLRFLPPSCHYVYLPPFQSFPPLTTLLNLIIYSFPTPLYAHSDASFILDFATASLSNLAERYQLLEIVVILISEGKNALEVMFSPSRTGPISHPSGRPITFSKGTPLHSNPGPQVPPAQFVVNRSTLNAFDFPPASLCSHQELILHASFFLFRVVSHNLRCLLP